MRDRHERSRAEWMRGPGTTRSIDVGHRIMDDVHESIFIPEITDRTVRHIVGMGGFPTTFQEDFICGSSAGLAAVVVNLHEEVDRATEDSAKMSRKYSGRNDYHRFEHAHGVGDQSFTWHYAPVLAHEIVKLAVRERILGKDIFDQISLKDWAEIFEYQWFRDLLHDLALAPNGTYGQRCQFLSHYYNSQNQVRIQAYPEEDENENNVLELSIQAEPSVPWEFDDQPQMVVARLAKEYRLALRSYLKKYSRTIGCPVARKYFTLELDQITDDSSLTRLISRGMLKAVSETDRGIRFSQEQTPIDRSLSLLAKKFERYDDVYGTPLVDEFGVVHDRRPQAHPLEIHT